MTVLDLAPPRRASGARTPLVAAFTPAALPQSKLYLSPSSLQKYETCPRQYWYARVLKWKSDFESGALAFGTAIDEATDAFLRSQVTGIPVDPVVVFVTKWLASVSRGGLSLPMTYKPNDMQAMGVALITKFVQAWDASGLRVAVDPKGEPILQRDLEIELPGRIVIRTKLDLLAVTPDGRIVLIDVKTAANKYSDDWIALSDQLTLYQIAVEAHKEALGISQIDLLGFLTMLKRKVPTKKKAIGPYVNVPPFQPRRSNEAIAEALQKVQWAAEDIRRKRFGRRPNYPFNSPCSYCDMRSHCVSGGMDGIIVPQATATPAT